MKKYNVQNDEGIPETLEVAAETELGYHVKISVAGKPDSREYRDFISRILFAGDLPQMHVTTRFQPNENDFGFF